MIRGAIALSSRYCYHCHCAKELILHSSGQLVKCYADSDLLRVLKMCAKFYQDMNKTVDV